MVSRSGSSGKVGKGLGSSWVTSGGLDGEVGAESTRNWVSGREDCNRCASDSSGEDCCERRVGSTLDWLRATGRWPRLRGAIGRRNSG